MSPAQPAPAGEWDQAFSQLDSGGAARPAVGSKLPQPAAPEPGPATGPTTFDLGAADPASAPMPVAPGPPGSAPNPAAPGSSGLMSAVADGSSPFPASPPAPLSPPAGTAAHKPLPPANPMAAIGLGDEEVSQELPGTPGGLAFDPGNDAWKARPAALDKPKMAERLWTVQRGERREQNIPESTIKRMAKEGKLLPDDLLSLPGEPPRPAHTFPSLGVSAAASRPSSDDGSPQPRPTPATGPTRPVGARRKSRRPLVFAALALALIGGAAGLYVTQPELVKAGLDTALPWLGELGDTIADDIDATLSGGPSPVAHLRPDWEASLGAPEPGRDPKQRVADLVLEADKASAKETVAGDAAAVLALKKALLLDDQHLPAIGRLLVRLAQQADGPAALERMGAEQVLNASLTRDRDEPWLRRARAAMALAGHDLAAADVDLARLGEGGTEDLELVLLRARAQLERDQAAAAQWVGKARALAPASTRAMALDGALARRDHRPRAAGLLLDARLKAEPKDRFAILERARLNADVGKPGRGAALLTKWLAGAPGDDEARLLAARLHMLEGELSSARALLAKAPKAGTVGARARGELLGYRAAVAERPDPKEAASLLEQHPQLAMSHVAAGLAALGRKDQEAAKHLRQALDATGGDVATWILRSLLGEAEYGAGRFEEALASFQWAQQLRPDYLPAHVGEVLTLLKLDRLKDADAALQQLTTVDLLAVRDEVPPRRWPPRDAFGALANELKDLPEAKADPYVTTTARAAAALGSGDVSAAMGLLGNALKTRRNDPLALTLLGAAELVREKPRKAVARVGLLEVREDLQPASRLVLGRALIATKATRRARVMLRPLEGTDRYGAIVLRLLGEAELADGNAPKAARLLDGAFYKNPDDAVTRLHLADLENDRP